MGPVHVLTNLTYRPVYSQSGHCSCDVHSTRESSRSFRRCHVTYGVIMGLLALAAQEQWGGYQFQEQWTGIT